MVHTAGPRMDCMLLQFRKQSRYVPFSCRSTILINLIRILRVLSGNFITHNKEYFGSIQKVLGCSILILSGSIYESFEARAEDELI